MGVTRFASGLSPARTDSVPARRKMFGCARPRERGAARLERGAERGRGVEHPGAFERGYGRIFFCDYRTLECEKHPRFRARAPLERSAVELDPMAAAAPARAGREQRELVALRAELEAELGLSPRLCKAGPDTLGPARALERHA